MWCRTSSESLTDAMGFDGVNGIMETPNVNAPLILCRLPNANNLNSISISVSLWSMIVSKVVRMPRAHGLGWFHSSSNPFPAPLEEIRES